jgi:hypothetical protein
MGLPSSAKRARFSEKISGQIIIRKISERKREGKGKSEPGAEVCPGEGD